ncbi:MAG: FlgD immunoglobulin-like domain containing protein [Armatimonadia bacterium]
MLRSAFRWSVLCVVAALAVGMAAAAQIDVPGVHGPTIQAAITAANDGDVVVVAPGSYAESLNYQTKTITVRSTDPEDPAVVANTILDGGLSNGSVVNMDGSSGTISGFTITNGGPTTDGGGVHCFNGVPTITNNVFFNNRASCGGAIYVWGGGDPIISNNVIRGNFADQFGGGAYFTTGFMAVIHFTNNRVTGNLATLGGGGVYEQAVGAEIYSNTISGNSPDGLSVNGAAYHGLLKTSIKDCIIESNFGKGLQVAAETDLNGISYCNVFNNTSGNYSGLTDPTGTNGNISVDPLFDVEYRLKSHAGRWNGSTWIIDALTSPCLDAGDPTSDYSHEPSHNGGRINMGFDGNTQYASKSANRPPTRPEWVRISPAVPGKEDLTGVCDDSTDPDGDGVTYEYQWAKVSPTGGYLTKWVDNPGKVLTADKVNFGETWQVRARSFDGTQYSLWKAHKTATIVRMAAAVSPASGATNVPVTSPIDITFKWPVNQLSVNQRLRVYQGANLVPGAAMWIKPNLKVRFTPKASLAATTQFEVRLASGIVCSTGRVLGWSESYNFTTAGSGAATVVTISAAPTAMGAQVTVNLSSAATVRTVICNIAGRVVAQLPQRELEAGVSSLVWNGKGSSGTKVPAGTYLVRVEAMGAEGTQATALTPLQVR